MIDPKNAVPGPVALPPLDGMNETLEAVQALINQVSSSSGELHVPSQPTVAAAYTGFRALHGFLHRYTLATTGEAPPQQPGTRVWLYGWGQREGVSVIPLPLPVHPAPSTIITLEVPDLNDQIRKVRPNPDRAYPEEEGVLIRDEAGHPVTLHVLGRTWPVTRQVEQASVQEVDATLEGPELRAAVSDAIDRLRNDPGSN